MYQNPQFHLSNQFIPIKPNQPRKSTPKHPNPFTPPIQPLTSHLSPASPILPTNHAHRKTTLHPPLHLGAQIPSPNLRICLCPTRRAAHASRIAIHFRRQGARTPRSLSARHTSFTGIEGKAHYSRLGESATETNFGFGMCV